LRKDVIVTLLVLLLLPATSYAQVVGGGPVIGGGGSGGGSGDVTGPSSSTDNALVRFDSTTGKIIQTSNLTCSDVSGVTTTLATITPAATTGATVAGQALAITASPAVASTDTAGAAAGGAISITAGAAARNASGNASGGDINLTTGAGIGTGSGGSVIVSSLNTNRLYDLAGNFYLTSSGIQIATGNNFRWGNDTAFSRTAAGVIRVTDASTGIRGLLGGGTAVASATAMPVPTGRVFHVTGTTTLTSVLATNFQSGVVVTLIFDGILTVTDGSNLKLAGDFVTTADDVLTLAYDGSNWFEVSRSVN
jgi:hypothetical protein